VIPATRRERYLQQDVPTRLGGLAADLARIVSFAGFKDDEAVESFLEESRAFIEWSAPDLLPNRVEDAGRLVEIHRGLTHWYWLWKRTQINPEERNRLREDAQAWSDEILEMSGLLEQE
jgi:hypothetical protein